MCTLSPSQGLRIWPQVYVIVDIVHTFCYQETALLMRVAGPSGLGELTSRLEEEEEEQICPAPGGPFSALQARQKIREGRPESRRYMLLKIFYCLGKLCHLSQPSCF
jgi:hypothetical protein